MADEGRIKKTRKDIGSVAKVPKGTFAPVGGSGYGRFFLSYPLKHTGGEHERGNLNGVHKEASELANLGRSEKSAKLTWSEGGSLSLLHE